MKRSRNFNLENLFRPSPTNPQDHDSAESVDRSPACAQTLYGFLKAAWPVIEPATPFVHGWHIQAICDHLEAVFDGKILNLYIAVPPGSTKSITCNVIFPAWAWIHQPSLKFLCAANAGDLVTRDAVASRRLIEDDWYRENWGNVFALTTDQNVKTWYENNRRGFRISVTPGSRTTGRKGDIELLDDPHDTKEVESDVQRTSVTNWWKQAFFNRVNNAKTGRRVVIGQRTHSDDLPAFILKSQGFVELRIPEEFEADYRCVTPLPWQDPRTKDGELLRPERFGPAQVIEAKETLGEMGYAAQHQQRPVQRSGGLFKRDWLRQYHRAGDYYWIKGSGVLLSECRRFATVDLAASTKTTADYTVIAIWADDKAGNLILVDVIRGRFEGPDIVPKITQAIADWNLSFVAVESTGFQITLIQEARRRGLPVRELNADRDKVTRALPATVRMEAGKVWFPEKAPYLAALLDELFLFPQGAHDDMVDCFAYAAAEMLKLYQSTGARPMPLAGGARNVAPVIPRI